MVFEVAKGADVTTKVEAHEFVERMERGDKFMTTSCCAGYNQLVKKHMPEIAKYVSDAKTPLYYTSEMIKKEYPDAVTVFVSPCVAKRAEGHDNDNVDFVMSAEELSALFTAHKIDTTECEETKYDVESSKQARNFAVTGGVAQAVKSVLVDESKINPMIINGLNKDSIKQLKTYAKNGECEHGCNMIEVMCCEGGCVCGNATIHHPRVSQKILNALVDYSESLPKDVK